MTDTVVMDEPTIVVSFDVAEITCDPVQYKPYSPTLKPMGLILEVEIPAELANIDGDERGDLVIVGMDGFKCLLKKLANMVAEADRERRLDRISQLTD